MSANKLIFLKPDTLDDRKKLDGIIVRYEKEKGIDVKVTYVRPTDYEAKLNSAVSLKREMFIVLPAKGMCDRHLGRGSDSLLSGERRK
jgi:hypothetical protein